MADPPIDDKDRAIHDRALERIPHTKTSMTTEAPPLEQRPQKAPKYSLIVKKIDIFVLAGSSLDPEEELAAASRIWSQCGIAFESVSRTQYDEHQTRALLGTNPGDDRKPVSELTVLVDPDETTPSMRNLRNEWSQKGRGQLAAFFAPKVRLVTSGAPSAADPELDIVYIGVRQAWLGWDLAHELGHRLIGPELPHAALRSPLMKPNQPGNEIEELECRAARGDYKARFEFIKRSERL